jgi:hypothetical protein
LASVRARRRKGSGSCTAPRRDDSSSARTVLANEAPPKPLSSVGLPTRTRALSAPLGADEGTTASASTMPTATTFTRQLPSKPGSK